jgi:UDP:flavonoid glycosyltransferase YjiC (YdhE family)
MEKKILFWPDVYKEQGHWLPTFVWAKELLQSREECSYTVSYMGIPDCKSLVEWFDKSINYYEIFKDLYPLGYTDQSHTTPEGRWKPEHVLRIINGELDDIFSEENKPDVLVSGYFTSLESLIIHRKYNVKVIISTTYLRHPENDPAMRAVQNLTAYSDAMKKRILMFKQEKYSWHPLVLRREIPIDDFVKPLTTFHELIPCPREFDYPHYEHGSLVHYVEPCMTPLLNDETNDNNISLNNQANDDNLNEENQANEVSIFWNSFLSDKKQNIIFATAGSQILDYGKKAEHMFDELIRMMDAPQMKNYHLLLSVGEKLLRTRDWEKVEKKNVTVKGWVPQRLILSSKKVHCAFIHGGLATIKECIYFGVPFVIAPMGKDQLDNALRLRENGIDNMVDVDASVADCYLYSINKVRTDFRIKNNLKKLRQIFKASEIKHEGVSIIKFVANSTT